MKFISTIGAFSLLGFVALSAVMATEPPRKDGPVATACEQDVKALCSGVKPGEGRMAQCLKHHHDKVSSGCKAALKSQRQHRPKKNGDQPSGTY